MCVASAASHTWLNGSVHAVNWDVRFIDGRLVSVVRLDDYAAATWRVQREPDDALHDGAYRPAERRERAALAAAAAPPGGRTRQTQSERR